MGLRSDVNSVGQGLDVIHKTSGAQYNSLPPGQIVLEHQNSKPLSPLSVY